MEVKEVIEKFDRNYDVEKSAIEQMAHILGPYISKKQINKILEENGFNGVYVLSNDIYNSVTDELMTMGYYDRPNKVVIMNEDDYFKDSDIAIHELCHAYLDDKNIKTISIGSENLYFGKGLEEGAATILKLVSNLDDIDNVRSNHYSYQCCLFQQLNVLYRYSKINELPNLLVYLMKYPETFISLIRDVYYEILQTNKFDFNQVIVDRSAYCLIDIADTMIKPIMKPTTEIDKLLTEITKKFYRNIYTIANYINSLYLIIADKDIYNGKKANPLFYVPKEYIVNSELEKLFQLFRLNVEEKQLQDLERLMFKYENITSDFEEDSQKIMRMDKY